MALAQALLPEFDHEMAGTRRTLERVPEGRLSWRPHPKSYTLGELATHLANLHSWIVRIFENESVDIAPPGQPPRRPEPLTSRQALLATFDKHLAEGRARLAAATDEQMRAPWTLLFGGKTVFTMPRAASLRSMVMNHGVHHRAQLGVYLRLLDVSVPGLYGPSADEQ
ncbi:MAG TPA: DinB family protein [Vicinamibacteria bacterium]|nr:DinB family protein [Vicinamibacteria bacterium]